MKLLPICAALMLSGCAAANTIQTSQNTAIVQAAAAPACGGIGAARVAQKQAAKATLQAGYDRYIIYNGASANNVGVVQGPGSYNTTANVVGNSVYARTTYTPGMPMMVGTHDQQFGIRMFKEGEPGANEAIDARSTLGPKWAQEMKRTTLTCT